MLRRAGILALVFFASEDLATATTIVIMRTTTGFVVGADSLARVEEINGTRHAEHICKVGSLGPNQYVVVAGIVEFLPSGLDAWRIIEKIAAGGGRSLPRAHRSSQSCVGFWTRPRHGPPSR